MKACCSRICLVWSWKKGIFYYAYAKKWLGKCPTNPTYSDATGYIIISICHWEAWIKWGSKPKNWGCHFTWASSAAPSQQDALACTGLSHSFLMKCKDNSIKKTGFIGKKKIQQKPQIRSHISKDTISTYWQHCISHKKQHQRAINTLTNNNVNKSTACIATH